MFERILSQARFVKIRHRRTPRTSRCAHVSATMAAQDIMMNGCGISSHQMIESCTLARNQELGRGVVEPLALQLPDGRTQFENLGAQL
jgi:hypothetical protein